MNNFLSYLGHLFRIIKTVIIKRNLPGHSFYRYINVISFCEADVGNVSGGRFESGNNVSCHWNCQIHIKYGKWLKKSSENKDINMDTKSYVLKLQHQYVLQRLGKYYFLSHYLFIVVTKLIRYCVRAGDLSFLFILLNDSEIR